MRLRRSKMLENIEEAFDTAQSYLQNHSLNLCSIKWGNNELGLRAAMVGRGKWNHNWFLAVWTEWQLHQQRFDTAKLVSTWERALSTHQQLLRTDTVLSALWAGAWVDPAAAATQQCRAASHSASHCSLSASLRLLLSERSAYIQTKKIPDWSFSSTPPLDINMESFYLEKKASCFFFFTLLYEPKHSPANLGGLDPPGFCPGSDQEQPDTE